MCLRHAPGAALQAALGVALHHALGSTWQAAPGPALGHVSGTALPGRAGCGLHLRVGHPLQATPSPYVGDACARACRPRPARPSGTRQTWRCRLAQMPCRRRGTACELQGGAQCMTEARARRDLQSGDRRMAEGFARRIP